MTALNPPAPATPTVLAQAAREVIKVLEPLSRAEQERVLRSVCQLLGVVKL